MRIRLTLVVFSIIAIHGSVVGSAQSPSFGRPGTPTTSPYLNLIPGSNFSPAMNYYRSYRPEREFRRDAQQFTRSISSLRKQVDQIGVAERTASSQLRATGHPTTFHNLGSYFPQR